MANGNSSIVSERGITKTRPSERDISASCFSSVDKLMPTNGTRDSNGSFNWPRRENFTALLSRCRVRARQMDCLPSPITSRSVRWSAIRAMSWMGSSRRVAASCWRVRRLCTVSMSSAVAVKTYRPFCEIRMAVILLECRTIVTGEVRWPDQSKTFLSAAPTTVSPVVETLTALIGSLDESLRRFPASCSRVTSCNTTSPLPDCRSF